MKKEGIILAIFLLILSLLCQGCENTGYGVRLSSERIELVTGESKEVLWDVQVTPQGRQDEEETAAEKERIVNEIQAGGNFRIEIDDPQVARAEGTRMVGVRPGKTRAEVKVWYRAEEQPPKGVKARNEVLLSAVVDVVVEESGN